MSFAQDKEDVILSRFFTGQSDGFFVEVGALDGLLFSNTYLLEKAGWQGVCVEPNPEVCGLLAMNRPRSRCFYVACVDDPTLEKVTLYLPEAAALATTTLVHADWIQKIHEGNGGEWDGFKEITVPARTLDSILDECAPAKIDLVSIDTEWTNAETLRGFDLARWQPRVVIVEQGEGVADLMGSYHFVAERSSNLFYVRDARDVDEMRKAL